MREWREEKRNAFLMKILEQKATGRNILGVAGKCVCGVGMPVWRCFDCVDKRATCLLCFRSRHKNDIFHRVEKWNGAFYQKAALWQVGVKIFVGHNGEPCPRSITALSQIPASRIPNPLIEEMNIDVIAQRLMISASDLLLTISEILQQPVARLTCRQHEIVDQVGDLIGKSSLEVLQIWKALLLQNTEQEADETQRKSDSRQAEAETIEADSDRVHCPGAGPGPVGPRARPARPLRARGRARLLVM